MGNCNGGRASADRGADHRRQRAGGRNTGRCPAGTAARRLRADRRAGYIAVPLAWEAGARQGVAAADQDPCRPSGAAGTGLGPPASVRGAGTSRFLCGPRVSGLCALGSSRDLMRLIEKRRAPRGLPWLLAILMLLLQGLFAPVQAQWTEADFLDPEKA